mmetsp:Transcript_11273/g.21338  ORF Transcript_11273/g.21338 Transcript_11273/m.21338 type:complete len:203 (-) Transcript_11273:129-737(-)|eukprot:CAMPEP_0114229264 /NCGR_PEP_ID=MMETSP0058-20121206/2810_1 /TAXON_ID=36894 /ORGANISM="Pyramimonas parkeae, CCMP726" /LENGTH=202 /DNA_ID=CAMNT_0001340319 /DNA_START=352 /DNA_END=960 /DNA_ORIENTATION=+
MACFGKTSVELVRDVRDMEPDTLPPFKDEAIRNVLEEMDDHYNAMNELIGAVQATGVEWGDTNFDDASSILTHHNSILRNKRNVLAYLMARVKRIKQLRWSSGRSLSETLESNASATEKQFFREYDRLLMSYQGKNEGVSLDLTLDMLPPKDHKIEVRVLEDHGDLFSRDGPLILNRNTVHFLWREDAQPLIAEGVVVPCTH